MSLPLGSDIDIAANIADNEESREANKRGFLGSTQLREAQYGVQACADTLAMLAADTEHTNEEKEALAFRVLTRLGDTCQWGAGFIRVLRESRKASRPISDFGHRGQ